MTNPENIRRRQYRLGIIVMILGVLTVAWGIVLETQNVSQRHCLQSSLAQLNNAFTVRAGLNDQRNEIFTEKSSLTDQQVSAQRRLIKDVSVATNRTDVARAFTRFNRTDAHLAEETVQVSHHLAEITREIKITQPPSFPEGKCS